MPVAARVVSDSLITAAIASFEMSAQCRRAALADIAQHLPLLVRQRMAPALKELVLMSMEDIGHFEPMSCHAVLFPPWAVRDIRMGRSSSGLARSVQPGFGDVQISRRSLQIAMAKQELDAAQIGAGIEKMGSEGVPQHMRAEGLRDAQLLAQLLADNTHCVGLQWLSRRLPGKSQSLGLRQRQ